MKKFVLITLILFAFAATLMQCKIEKPIAPSWDTDLIAPLINSSYTAIYLANKNNTDSSKKAIVGSNNILAYVYQPAIKSFNIGDTLKIRDTSSVRSILLKDKVTLPSINSSGGLTLGNIAITSLPPSGRPITDSIGQRLTLLAAINGIQSQPASIVLPNVQAAQTNDGYLVIRIQNLTRVKYLNLGVVISDSVNGTIGTCNFATVDTVAVPLSDTSVTRLIRLNNKRFTNALTSQINIGTIPIQRTGIIDTSLALRVTIKDSLLNYQSLTGLFPGQTVTDSGKITISSSQIRSLQEIKISPISKGRLNLQINNQSNFRGSGTISFPKITSSSGQSVSFPLSVTPYGTSITDTSTAGFDITFSPSDSTSVSYTTVLTLPQQTVTLLPATDQFTSTGTVSSTTLSYVSGIIDSLSYDISQPSITINAFSKANGTISLVAPKITATATNAVGFAIELNPQLTSLNTSLNQSVTIGQKNGQPFSPSDTTFLFGAASTTANVKTATIDTSNSNVRAALSLLPNIFKIAGTARLNPGLQSGTVRNTDTLSIAVRLEVPLNFSSAGIGFRDTTTLTSTIDPKGLQSGEFDFIITNGLPVGLSFKADVLDQANHLLFSLPTNGDSLQVKPSQVDANGNATTAVASTLVAALTSTEISKIGQAKFIVSRISADTRQSTAGLPVEIKIHATDPLRIQASAKLKYRVNQ
jgi:hypothetical protein